MKLFIVNLLVFLFPVLSIADVVMHQHERLSIAINHDDGGKLSQRHLKKLLDALDQTDCKVVVGDVTSAKLVFDPQPVSMATRQRPDYRLVARARSLDGTFTLRGAIVVHASTGITDLSTLRNEWVSFVSKTSWSGYRLPLELFKQAGINDQTNNFYFVGNHVGVVAALLHRDVHVAVTVEPLAKHWAEQNDLSIVAVTDEVETGGWWLHNSVTDELARACAQAMTTLDGNRYKSLPAWVGGFIIPD